MTDEMTVRKRPCGSCPYRRDVPSGVWAEHEYRKLPLYDGSTLQQFATGTTGVFLCHSSPDNLCAGWVGCHDMQENLGLRMEAARGTKIDPTVFDYESPIPLWASGEEACAHGLTRIENPDAKARQTVAKLEPVIARRPKRLRK